MSSLDANAQAQILDAGGHVLAATRNLTGLPAVYELPAGTTNPVRQKAADGVIPTDVEVVATRTTVAGRSVTVVAGTGTGLLQLLDNQFVTRLLLAEPFAPWSGSPARSPRSPPPTSAGGCRSRERPTRSGTSRTP
jgi:hypothetical protein